MYRKNILSSPPSLIKGIKNFLTSLQQANIPTAIASSTDKKNITTILDSINLTHSFDAIVAAEDVIIGKPDPEVFLKAAEALQIQPEHCVIFEDSPLGIKGGLTARMKTIGIATTHPTSSLNEAHLVVDSFNSLTIKDLEGVFN